MSADDEVDGIAVQDATLDHCPRSADSFFGGLKEKRELSLEFLAPSCQEIGHTEQPRYVDVVPARVHDTTVLRDEGEIGSLFAHGQPVHVGTNHHAPSRSCAHQPRYDAGNGGTRANLESELD